jgi:hypothetical protein
MFTFPYGAAVTFLCPVIDAGTTDFALSADWTPASGDVKVSTDEGSMTNIGTLPTIVGGTGGALWKFTLTATEMEGKHVDIQIVDSATKAVEDQAIHLETIMTVEAEAEAGTLSTAVMTTTLAEVTDNHYNGRVGVFEDGILDGQAFVIDEYSGTNGTITFAAAVTEAPIAAQKFRIY